MANPTTNFGWVMPTSTDLVTDLPADFNTFGQGVDTTLAELKGGTTGQVLSKTSATDMDFTWTTANPGDITAVTAGTGISGGGTSGDVTVTNSMATAFTTSGDLIQATGSGTFARLATGTTGQYLTTNGTTNSWATPSSPASKGCSIYLGGAFSISNTTVTTITWDQELFDTDSFHSTATNTDRITIPAGLGGKYLVTWSCKFTTSAGTFYNQVKLFKNAGPTQITDSGCPGSVVGTNQSFVNMSFIVNATAGDYFYLSGYQNSGSTQSLAYNAIGSFFSMMYLGA